jgi:protein MpaA
LALNAGDRRERIAAMGRIATLRMLGARCVATALAAAAMAADPTALAGAAGAAGARPAPRCLVGRTTRTIGQLWRPDMAAAVASAHSRVGDIAFAVRTQGRFYGYRPDHDEWSASVVKAMLLVTYLDSAAVRNRPLTTGQEAVLGPMIRASDNDDAHQIFDTDGQAGLRALAQRVGMTGFATNPVWGETRIDPRDQTRFLLHIDGYVVARHRSYAMRLLRSVIGPQRWGIGELALPGWKKYFKGGWGYGTGLEDHQVVLLTRGCARVSIAVQTMAAGATVAARSRRVVIGHSVRGRPIAARVLGPDAAPRRLLLVGCIHGNECAGTAILSALARRPVPMGVQLWLVAELNPDGTAAGTRQNAHGVDLNRNFPYRWERITDPTYDSGPRPASEPETRAAMALIRRIRPAVTIWYHQHMDLTDMAGGDNGVARRYAQLSGLRATCLGIVHGTAPAWSNHLLPGTAAFVVELPAGPVTPAALARHLRAVRAMEAGQRSGSRTSCAP